MELGERIRRAREAKGLSQAQLAKAIGITQPAIQDIEKGDTKRSRYLHDIAGYLGLEIESRALPGLAEESAGYIPARALMGSRDFPVYSSAEGGSGQIILSADPVDWVPRPVPVARVPKAYGLYIVGDSMVPEFEPGDVALVNPHLPLLGNATYIFYAEMEGEARATIKRLRRATSEQWLVTQWNPPAGMKSDFALARREWRVAHRVLGKYYRS
jgi:transcriptional regulator with XRE-family HTH domain